jgi:hypothetical protein
MAALAVAEEAPEGLELAARETPQVLAHHKAQMAVLLLVQMVGLAAAARLP